MNEDEFWSLIAMLDWENDDREAIVEPLVAALAKRSDEDLFGFHDLLAAKLHALDGEVYARNIGDASFRGEDEFFSLDVFLYARCCVVANGRAYFERVLADPAAMPKEGDFEPLLYVPESAYARKTDGAEYPHFPSIDYETYANLAGWGADSPT